jgi:nicotinamidase-related amidase
MAQQSTHIWERIDKNNAALLIIDHQVGLFQIVGDYSPAEYKNNILAFSALGKVFNLPVVMTTSAETGPNGPLPREILEMHASSPLIKRNGEVNAWDNEEFRDAVKATGKKQLIVAGITTDVCVLFLSLSLVQEGYTVFACTEASGTFNERIAREAFDRMQSYGVQVMSNFGIATDLMRDWRHNPGAEVMFPYFDRYLPQYGMVARGHLAAQKDGSLLPGQEGL